MITAPRLAFRAAAITLPSGREGPGGVGRRRDGRRGERHGEIAAGTGAVVCGAGADGTWKVSALIGVDEGAGAPALSLEGKRAAAPVTLLRHQGRVYLRYDLSCKARKDERRVSYAIDGVDETWQFTVPAKGAAPRMAYVSCNGFSDPGGMRKLIKAENAVGRPAVQPRQAAAAGRLCARSRAAVARGADPRPGRPALSPDADGRRPDLFRFDLGRHQAAQALDRLTRDEQLRYPVDAALEREIEDYYLRLYADRWLRKDRAPWVAGRRRWTPPRPWRACPR